MEKTERRVRESEKSYTKKMTFELSDKNGRCLSNKCAIKGKHSR